MSRLLPLLLLLTNRYKAAIPVMQEEVKAEPELNVAIELPAGRIRMLKGASAAGPATLVAKGIKRLWQA